MWFIFTIFTTLVWGLAELFYKKGARENERYSHLKISVYVGLVMGIHAIIVLNTQNINYNFANLIYYLPVSFCYIFSMSLSFFGMRFIEESISDPIENTSGAIVAIMCFLFLGQTIDKISILAIILIVIGILGIGYFEINGKNKKKEKIGKKLFIIAFAMPFLYAIFDAIGTFLDAYYLEIKTTPLIDVTEENIELVANTSYELTFFIVAIILIVYMLSKNEKFEIEGQNDKILAAICETIGQLTYVYAMSGNAMVAAPIISSVCVVSVLLSRIFLKEKLLLKQYIAIIFVIMGIVLLGFVEGISE